MSKQRFLLFISIILLFPGLNAQALIKNHHFSYKEIDRENCSAKNIEYTFPLFYSENGKPLTVVNDSIGKILLNTRLDDVNFLADFLVNGRDTSIVKTDTLTAFGCDQISLVAEDGHLDYTIFINTDHVLSFAITSSYYAGAGGNGGMNFVYAFCYDLKNGRWLNISSLFTDKFDTMVRAKTDRIYLEETGYEALDESFHFTGEVSIKPGSLVFYYSDHMGGKYFYREIIIPYEEYEKHLLPRYQKLLKPAVPH